ncbi:DUF2914 domain-containing protein [Patescibacteria group bacterium]|nr:DUF2914 domain-containing protein [Patescibacteria group bacterium]
MESLRQKIKKHGSAVAFILGFAWDNVMIGRIDHAFANIMLGTYLTISAFCIIALNIHVKKNSGGPSQKYGRWLAIIMQFCFGSLMSAYIIFYTRSASLAASWPFLAFLVLMVLGNELLRERYHLPRFQIPIFFIVLFSYAVFSLPIIVGRIGSDIFMASGLVSVAIVSLLWLVGRRAAPEAFASDKRAAVISVAAIYMLFNIAYFEQIIPPVPLALKYIGVYHLVTRNNDGSYSLSFEPGFWYPIITDTSGTYHKSPGEPVYVWSSVFAPTRITTPLFYRWSYFDASKNAWVTTDLVPFQIVGGRDAGFRGYTFKTGAFPALWQVSVETAQGALIGETRFTVATTTAPGNNLVTMLR